MESHVKYCVINAGTGQWYVRGSKRLERSLNFEGFGGDILIWSDFPTDVYDKNCAYNIKAACLEEAINRGYTHVLWADCSMWAVGNVDKLFDYINDEGFYAETNGNNCAQECNDYIINHYQITRDEAEAIPMCSSGLLGVNINNPKGKAFAEEWIEAAKSGLFNGSRNHDGQSQDKRFLHHRQDQSAASLLCNKLGIKLLTLGTFWEYYPKTKDSTIFLCRGM